jgi:hypothetical protein
MLAQNAALQGVALLQRHRGNVQRIGWRLVRRLLQLAPVDELHVGDRRSSRFSGIFVLQPASQRGENSRKIIVQRRPAARSRICSKASAGTSCGRGGADRSDNGVGTALEEQVEEAAAADEADAPPQQAEQTMFRQARRACGCDRLADARRNLAAGPELPGRIRPLAVLGARGD